MAKPKKDYSKYEEIPIKDWNGTSFRAYLKACNLERFGRLQDENPLVENSCIAKYIKQTSKEHVKDFITRGVELYQPNARFPAPNFSFMYNYQRNKIEDSLLQDAIMKEEKTLTDSEDYGKVLEDIKNLF